jgi:tetratricopeptide (TPR) repeat protein
LAAAAAAGIPGVTVLTPEQFSQARTAAAASPLATHSDKAIANVAKLTATMMKDKPLYSQHRYVAQILHNKRKTAQALIALQEAVKAYREDPLRVLDPLTLPDLLSERAQLELALGNRAAAEASLNECMQAIEPITDPSAARLRRQRCRQALIDLYRSAPPFPFGKLSIALDYLRDADEKLPRADMCHFVAHVLNEEQKFADAEQHAREA